MDVECEMAREYAQFWASAGGTKLLLIGFCGWKNDIADLLMHKQPISTKKGARARALQSLAIPLFSLHPICEEKKGEKKIFSPSNFPPPQHHRVAVLQGTLENVGDRPHHMLNVSEETHLLLSHDSGFCC